MLAEPLLEARPSCRPRAEQRRPLSLPYRCLTRRTAAFVLFARLSRGKDGCAPATVPGGRQSSGSAARRRGGISPAHDSCPITTATRSRIRGYIDLRRCRGGVEGREREGRHSRVASQPLAQTASHLPSHTATQPASQPAAQPPSRPPRRFLPPARARWTSSVILEETYSTYMYYM